MGFKSQCLILTALAVLAAGYVFDSVDFNPLIDIGASQIVGGSAALVGTFPHSVALIKNNSETEGVPDFSCGGSLISQNAVVTAGHCLIDEDLNPLPPTDLQGRVGSNNWSSGGTLISFARILRHPNHNTTIVQYDIGLMFTTASVVFSKLVQPVKLDFDYVGVGVKCVVSGWGRILTNGPIREQLQQLKLVTVDGDSCKKEIAEMAAKRHYDMPDVYPELEICAVHTGKRFRNSVCNGDSGSGLIRSDTGALIGTVDWGIPCGRGTPDVYVRISAVKDWLLENINP